MKFDVVVGNPPYQEETDEKESKNGQKPVTNIFPYFQDLADKVANEAACLIYPGGRWIHRSGKGMSKFGLDQINNPNLASVTFFKQSKDLFDGVGIPDGVTIVLKEYQKSSDGFNYEFVDGDQDIRTVQKAPGKQLIELDPRDSDVMSKIQGYVAAHHLSYLSDGIYSRSLFRIESDFVEKNPEAVTPYDNQTFDSKAYVKVLTNDKAGKAGRAKWFLIKRSAIPAHTDLIDKFQVVVSSANAGGQKRANQIEIMDNHSAFGRARVALKSFKTLKEAQNFYAYANTDLVKFAFLMTDEALTSLAKKVPDLLDYSDKNKLVDYDKDLNSQINGLFGITKSEDEYMLSRIPKRN